ncbi:MAG TPA: hypothetical protein VJS92_00985 [Candidatus Polarisedimenticolaceae bacterium]|nr:hypothetical protein [Candidatus Polarisedimenticolaceae bacterium]
MREAAAFIAAALELERRFGVTKPQARYLSYYGLCLGLLRTNLHEAVQFCREAVAFEGYDADLRGNLGRVLLVAGRRREAYTTLTSVLAMQPGHRLARRELDRMGARRRPVLPFLTRGNPLNVFLGRLFTRPLAA